MLILRLMVDNYFSLSICFFHRVPRISHFLFIIPDISINIGVWKFLYNYLFSSSIRCALFVTREDCTILYSLSHRARKSTHRRVNERIIVDLLLFLIFFICYSCTRKNEKKKKITHDNFVRSNRLNYRY